MRRVDGRGVFDVEGGGGGLQEEPKPQWPPRSPCSLTGEDGHRRRGEWEGLPILTVCFFPNETPFGAHSAHSAHTLLGLLHRNPLRESLVRPKKLCALCALLPLSGVEFFHRLRLSFGQLLERRLAAELLG